MLFVNSNVSNLNAMRNLFNVQNQLNTTYQRLSSGLRINSAKDDAAGLQITDRMTSQINGLGQANRNASDGIALAQTAEGAMKEMTDMLQTMRTKALDAASSTKTQADRDAINKEVTALSSEINRISKKTTYNGHTILDGKDGKNTLLQHGKLNFQIGANAGDSMALDLSGGYAIHQMMDHHDIAKAIKGDKDLTFEIIGDAEFKKDVEGNLAKGFVSKEFVEVMHAGSQKVTGKLAANGGGGNGVLTWTDGTNALDVGKSVTFDMDNETQIVETLNAALKVDGTNHKGSNVRTFAKAVLGVDIKLSGNGVAEATQIGNTTADVEYQKALKGIEATGVSMSTTQAAQNAIKLTDALIGKVGEARADLGAVQNRLESTIRNQKNMIVNTTDARARIRDTDFAEETANLNQQMILQQAAQMMMMQARQRPQMALQLLG